MLWRILYSSVEASVSRKVVMSIDQKVGLSAALTKFAGGPEATVLFPGDGLRNVGPIQHKPSAR